MPHRVEPVRCHGGPGRPNAAMRHPGLGFEADLGRREARESWSEGRERKWQAMDTK